MTVVPEEEEEEGKEREEEGEAEAEVVGGRDKKKEPAQERRACTACACAPPSDGSDPVFDEMARKLQENVDRMEEAYFSPAHIRECKYPMNVGRMDDPDASARVGTVGESIELHLKFGPDGRVSEALFNSDGCGSTIASGSMLTQLVKGRSREELGKLTTRDLVEALGGMPPAQMHCVELAVEALREALGGSDLITEN